MAAPVSRGRSPSAATAFCEQAHLYALHCWLLIWACCALQLCQALQVLDGMPSAAWVLQGSIVGAWYGACCAVYVTSPAAGPWWSTQVGMQATQRCHTVRVLHSAPCCCRPLL